MCDVRHGIRFFPVFVRPLQNDNDVRAIPPTLLWLVRILMGGVQCHEPFIVVRPKAPGTHRTHVCPCRWRC